MFNLKGKTALITGASGGIGSAIAKTFAKAGCNIIISGTNIEKLEKLAVEINSEILDSDSDLSASSHTSSKPKIQIKVANLKNESDAQELVTSLEHIDIAICNAGINKDSLSMRMSNSDFQDVLDVNLKSTFIICRESIKKMLKNSFGRIICISSVVGVSGNPGQANYCASKAGMIGMVKSLAQEVAKRNITINAVAPGFIVSEMTQKLTEEQKDKIYSRIPMQKFGSPEDIANACVFLASSEAGYITGQTLHINGGMLMV
jgi:3-oxoacyl-[acyl-carrier protein] reductase